MKRTFDVVLAAIVASVVIACGDKVMKPAAHMLVDAGHMLVDAGSGLLDAGADGMVGSDATIDTPDAIVADAHAQQSCGSCTVSGPIELQGPLKVITADTDASRLKSGVLADAANWVQLTSGPFVLTDVTPEPVIITGSVSRHVETKVADAGDCTSGGNLLLEAYTGDWIHANATAASAVEGHVSGARYLVPAGKVLCGRGLGTWSGFAPY